MHKPLLLLLGALIVSAPLASHAAARAYSMDATRSTLTFGADQMGAPFEGHFGKFSASIRFDAADMAGSQFDVTVDLASADTGEEQRNGTLLGPDFFDIANFKTAHYVTSAITKTKTGTYQATGKLTLRDVTRDVTIAFSFTSRKEGAVTAFYLVGSATLKRHDFGVGRGEYEDPESVGENVPVKFNLRLLPAAEPGKKQIPKKPTPSTSK
jgi:polyisoprenoid-binding protein YceI